MARFYAETLAAAERLIQREAGERGRMAGARIRRSISTSYYALFHFLLEEFTARTVGTGPDVLKRRRIVSRVFNHRGMKAAFRKVQGPALDTALQDFFDVPAAPPFVRRLAETFIRAQEQRHEADYDLNANLSELDARVLIVSVRQVVGAWQHQNSPAERDFKQALALFMLLEGRLRTDAG